MTINGLRLSTRAFVVSHGIAVLLFTSLATVFLSDVLLSNKSLAAFDIILRQPNWNREFPIQGVRQAILLDSPTAHYPQRMVDWSAVKQGRNATYNPYIYSGMPWSPQGVGAFLTSIPQLITDVPNAIDWSIWIRLILAGVFMYLLLVELGLSRTTSIFGGIVWTYNLHQIVWMQFPQHLATQLWIPLLFLANVLVLKSRFRREYVVALLVVNVLFFTSGYTQIVLYTYIAVGIFNTLYLVLLGPSLIGTKLKQWVSIHLIYLGGVLFYVIGIYSEMQFINEGLRGIQDFRGRVGAGEFDWFAITAFVKSLFPAIEEIKRFYTPDYYGGIWHGSYRDPFHGNIVESSAYVGVLAVVFVIAGFLSLTQPTRRRTCAVFVVLMAIFFSLYHRNPIAISILKLIPLADKGSYGRFITLVIFFACIVAAFGLQWVVDRCKGARPAALWGAVGLFVAIPLIARAIDTEFMLAALRYPLIVVAIFSLTTFFIMRYARNARVIPLVAIAMTIADLFYSTFSFNTRMDNELIFPANNPIRYLLNDPEPYRVAVIAKQPLYRSNLLSYFQIPTIEGYSTVLPNRYAQFIDAVFKSYHITANGMLFLFDPNVKALRLLNVKYILSDEDLSQEGLEKVLTSNEHYIYRVRNWLPRAYCASDIIVQSDERQVLAKIRDHVEQLPRPAVLSQQLGTAEGGSCEIQSLAAYTQGTSFTVRASAPRLIVLPYSFSERWHAKINGRSVPLLRANAAFMALSVPAGESEVTVVYQNSLETIGALVLIIGAFVLLVLIARARPSNLTHAALGIVAVVVILKSSLSLPGVRNEQIPERSPLPAPLTVDWMGEVRDEKVKPSERLSRSKSITMDLEVPARGLTKLGFLAATYLRPQLAYDIWVTIYDESGRQLARQTVAGSRILDNNWFFVDIPTVTTPARNLKVAVSSEDFDPDSPLSLWLDKSGRLCVTAFYDYALVEPSNL